MAATVRCSTLRHTMQSQQASPLPRETDGVLEKSNEYIKEYELYLRKIHAYSGCTYQWALNKEVCVYG